MRLRSRRSLVLLSLLLSCASAPFARATEPALDRLAPADAVLALSVQNVPALRERFAATPFGRAWRDPQVEKFFAPLFAHPGYAEALKAVEEETGRPLAELLDFATGDVQLTVPLSSFKVGADQRFHVDALLAIEVGKNDAKIRELLARRQARQTTGAAYADSTEDYNGVTVHTLAPAAGDAADRTLAWALHDGRWFIATDRDIVLRALDALAAGGLAESLSTSPRYRAVLERAGGHPDYAFMFDVQAAYPVVAAAIQASQDPAHPGNPLGLEPASLLKALGFDALGMMSATGAIAADGSTVGDFSLTYTETRGLAGLLAYRDGPVAKPDWVPASWIAVTSQNFSFADVYDELERTLDRISPMLSGLATGQIKALDRQMKIDLRRDLIGGLGANVITGIALPAGATASAPPSYDELEQVFAVSLSDAAGFERAIDAIKTRFIPPGSTFLEKREYLGRTLYVSTTPATGRPGARPFAYAITDGWLIVSMGSAAPLETVLQSLGKGDASASFWARADVRRALDSVPASAFSVQVSDLAPVFSSLCAMAVKIQANRGDDEDPFVDASALPTAEIFEKYGAQVITRGEREADGLHFRTTTSAAPVR